MVKGLTFPVHIRSHAFRLSGQGHKPAEIVKLLKKKYGVSPSVTCIRYWLKVNAAPRTRGKPPRLDARMSTEAQKVRRFLRAHKGQATGARILREVTWAPGFNSSRAKMYRFLNSISGVRQATPRRWYPLSASDYKQRYKWTSARKNANVKLWKFADEKRWKLCGGRTRTVYYLESMGFPVRDKDDHTCGGMHTCGIIGLDGTFALEFCIGTMNGGDYMDVLKWHTHSGDVVVQDGARAHIAWWVREAATELGIELLDLPPRSPELNCHEDVWGRVSDIVYEDNKTYNNYIDLEAAIRSAWDTVSKDKKYIESIITSVGSRIRAIAVAKGHRV